MRELQGEGLQVQDTPPSSQRQQLEASSGSSDSERSYDESTPPFRQPSGLARPDPFSPGSTSGESSDSFAEEASATLRALRSEGTPQPSPARQIAPPAGLATAAAQGGEGPRTPASRGSASGSSEASSGSSLGLTREVTSRRVKGDDAAGASEGGEEDSEESSEGSEPASPSVGGAHAQPSAAEGASSPEGSAASSEDSFEAELRESHRESQRAGRGGEGVAVEEEEEEDSLASEESEEEEEEGESEGAEEELEGEESEDEEAAAATESEDEGVNAAGLGQAGVVAAVEARELPEPWAEVEAEDGRVYYWNEDTGETSWSHPGPALPTVEYAPRRSSVPLPPRRAGVGEAPASRHPHLGRSVTAPVVTQSTAGGSVVLQEPAAEEAAAEVGASSGGNEAGESSAGDGGETEEGGASDAARRPSLTRAAAQEEGALAAARRQADMASRSGLAAPQGGVSALAAEAAAAARGGVVRERGGLLSHLIAKEEGPAEDVPTAADGGESARAAVVAKMAAAAAAAAEEVPERADESDDLAPELARGPSKGRRKGRQGGLSATALLNEQQRHLKQSRTKLKHEQQVHSDRKTRLEAREAALAAREATGAARQAELEAWHLELEEYQAAQYWEHWRRDGMRSIMTELVRKVPRDEWKVRMQRALTQLELLRRENLRLRQELSSSRAGGDVGGGGSRAGSPVKGVLQLSPGGTAAVAAAASPGGMVADLVGFGSVSEEMLEQNAGLQEAVANAEQELRAARKLEASREGYLSVLQRDAQEAQSRNEAQQRRLEALTAESSKFKKEATRLRGEVASARMDAYEKTLIENELQGAKESGAAMHEQIERMHAENAALRDGDGLRRELVGALELLKQARAENDTLEHALQGRMQQGQVQLATALVGLHEAETDAEDAHEQATRRAAERARAQRRAARGEVLARLWANLRPTAAASAAAWALSTWHSAACFAETGAVFGDLREKVATLASCAERLAGEVEVLQLSESGGLQLRHLGLLHDNWKDVLLGELRESEQEAEHAKREHRDMSIRLRKREDDLVLMIERYDGAQAAQRELTARVAAASDGSTLHLARLRTEAVELKAAAEGGALYRQEAEVRRARVAPHMHMRRTCRRTAHAAAPRTPLHRARRTPHAAHRTPHAARRAPHTRTAHAHHTRAAYAPRVPAGARGRAAGDARATRAAARRDGDAPRRQPGRGRLGAAARRRRSRAAARGAVPAAGRAGRARARALQAGGCREGLRRRLLRGAQPPLQPVGGHLPQPRPGGLRGGAGRRRGERAATVSSVARERAHHLPSRAAF